MDQQKVLDILSGRASGVGPAVLRALLAAAEVPYAAAMRVRRWAYRKELLPSFDPGVPVISIGNITTGGTGKTPMVAWVVRRLRHLCQRPAVLTRGYKARAGQSDEAAMLRLQLQRPVIPLPTAGMGVAAAIPTEVPVFIDPRRAAGAKAAVAAGADVLVMDDGFQHLRLKRDLDIVLVDATCPLGFDHVLPRGLLREPLTALAAADAVVITHADMLDAAGLKALRSRLAELAPQATVHDASHQPTHLVDEVGNRRELSDLANKKVVAFCGLGNPGQFFGMLRHQSLGIDVANTLAFDDHAAYGPGELGQLDRLAGQCDAEVLVTTQKDAVKLPPHWSSRPVWALAMEMEITQGREALLARIDGVLRRP